MRRRPRGQILCRSSASLLFPGPPVGMHQHNEQSHNNEPGGIATMTNPQKTFSYTGDTSLPHRHLCPRREPAIITSRTWLENPRCYVLSIQENIHEIPILTIKADKRKL